MANAAAKTVNSANLTKTLKSQPAHSAKMDFMLISMEAAHLAILYLVNKLASNARIQIIVQLAFQVSIIKMEFA